jgi:hypothetical protein
VFFAYPLAASLLIQVPGLSNTALGVGEAILAAGLVGLVARIDVPRRRRERDDPLSWRLSHIAPPIVIVSLAIVGAVATVTTSFGGLYWLAAATALATDLSAYEDFHTNRLATLPSVAAVTSYVMMKTLSPVRTDA